MNEFDEKTVCEKRRRVKHIIPCLQHYQENRFEKREKERK